MQWQLPDDRLVDRCGGFRATLTADLPTRSPTPMTKILGLTGLAFAGAASGILTRPCCVLPVVMSSLGLSGVVAGGVVVTYRPAFTVASIGILAASVVITTTRRGGTAAKVIAVGMSVIAFIASRFWTGVM